MATSTRRQFLALGGCAATAALLPLRSAKAMPLDIPAGLQLWTVKDELAKDFAGTLRALKRIGYSRLEAAGWVDRSAADFRAGVADAGLECVSRHFGLRDLLTEADNLVTRLEQAKEVGVRCVVASSPAPSRPLPENVPWGQAVAQAMTLADWHSNAEAMNRVGAQAKAMGMRFGYHNHAAEFLEYDGKLAFHELLRLTDPELVTMELDIGWVAAAGEDPAHVLHHHGARIELLHIKDIATTERTPHKMVADETTTPIGKGSIDWPGVFAAARHARIDSWFVEQEAPFTQPPLDALAESFAYLNTLRG